jgi:hypothetical protein
VKRTRKDVMACVATGKNMDSYNKVNSLLMSDTSDTSSPSDSCSVMAKEHTRKKHQSMRELKTHRRQCVQGKEAKQGTKTATRVGCRKGKHSW